MLGHERVLCILVTLAALDTAERPRLKQHVIEADVFGRQFTGGWEVLMVRGQACTTHGPLPRHLRQ